MIHTTFGAIAIFLVMCTAWPSQASESNSRPVHVFAAASLKEALDAVATRWNQRQKIPVVMTYAGSNVLAKQIEHGAPAHLFISASTNWMEYLADQNLVRSSTRQTLIENRLVLIAPESTEFQVELNEVLDLSSVLKKNGRIAIPHPAVPAGAYANQALRHLGLWQSIQNRTAPSDNVRGSLLRVARGETPLGIVYQTDALAEPRVRMLDRFPEDSHSRIEYPVAVVSSSDHPAMGKFLNFLFSPDSLVEFFRRGFLTPAQDSN